MKENMYENYSKLESRVLESITLSDLKSIKNILESIKEPTLVSGVGGSSVVSNFLSKVLCKKNNIICENVTHRDINYKNIEPFKNIIVCSYGGENYGVNIALNNNLNKYILSRKDIDGIKTIKYTTNDIDKSFISISATLIPMTIVLLYYYNDISLIKDILSTKLNIKIPNGIIYEILTGYETNTASTFLESTLTESGIAIPIVHDKYDYCHGRSTLNYKYNNNLIFFNNNTELDKLYIEEINKHYKNIITFNKKYDDDIINDYYFTYISMLFAKSLAEKYNKDLSIVEYSPIVKKLYHYKGEM